VKYVPHLILCIVVGRRFAIFYALASTGNVNIRVID